MKTIHLPILSAIVGVFFAQTSARAVTIDTVTTLPLSDSSYSNASSSFQEPGDLLLKAWTSGTPSSSSSRGVRSTRNNAQSFTVDAAVYPNGIEMTGFAIPFRLRGNSTDTFGVSLFKIESGDANANPLVSSTNLLSGVSSLVLPTAASLGVADPTIENLGASGTAIFHFDGPLHLAPGAYAWQFLPSWTDTTGAAHFDWMVASSSYAGGRRFEDGAGSGTDMGFGIIATESKLSWNTDSDGDWTTAGNWTSGGPPNGANLKADLNFDLTADRTITLDEDQTVGILNVSDATAGYFAYQINGSGKLIFNNTGGAQINKTQDITKMTVTGLPPNGLNPNTAHDVIAVPIELQSAVTIRSNALNGILEFSGEIGNDGSNKNVTVRGPDLSNTESDEQGGKALVVFSTANSYGGTTTLTNGGRLRITDGQALGTGAIDNITGGANVRTIASLELAGGITVNNDVTKIAGTDASVDTIARIKSVSGHNTFAGDILGINPGGTNYPIHSVGTAPGDFFTFSGDIINSRSQVDNFRNLRFGGAGDGEVTGNIIETNTSNWAVVKDNAGTWTFSGTNSYQSTTTVNEGTLRIDGTQTGSGAYTVVGGTLEIGADGWLSNAAAVVNVNLNSTLSGSGLIEGSVVVNGTITPSGTGSVGTLTIGTVDLAGTYHIDIDGSDADRLDVLGNLDFDGASLTITEISPVSETGYLIATYIGALSGTFSSVPAGYEVDTDTPNEVWLVKNEDSGTAYAMWMDSFPTLTEEADREPGADPDGDGMANGIEYVLDGDPTQSSVDLLPQITVTGSDIIFTFHRSDVSKDGVTGVYVQYGTDLSGWTDLSVPVDAGVYGLVTVGETGDVTVTIPKDGDGKKFVRLKAAVEKLAVE